MPGSSPYGVVLADFRPILVRPLVPQRWMIDHTLWLMGASRCAREHLVEPESRRQALAEATEAGERYAVSPEIIRARQCCVFPPFAAGDPQPQPENITGLFAGIEAAPEGPTLDQRMAFFRGLLDEFLEAHYPASTPPPDDLIHVSTSGYLLPSPVQAMVSARQWSQTVVTHSYHMGCYGAFPAIRTAIGLMALGQVSGAPKKRIDLLDTEPLTLHLDATRLSPTNVVTATLFGDGFIIYSAFPDGEPQRRGIRGLRVLAMHETIVPKSTEDMTLEPGSHRFDMHLSLRVPVRIRNAIRPFIVELCRRAGVDFAAERDRLCLAIHPGGTKILDVVAEALEVPLQRLEHSRQVLFEHGNMASATIPHVLHRILADPSIEVGTKVVTAAFGPGLTVTGLVLEKV